MGLIGSGVFVTDPVGGFPLDPLDGEQGIHAGTLRMVPTHAGMFHNLCAIPIFVGVPIAACSSAAAAVRKGNYGWACYSTGSSLFMAATFVLFGKAFAGAAGLDGKGGVLQRISIVSGFGWLTALSLRARSSRMTR